MKKNFASRRWTKVITDTLSRKWKKCLKRQSNKILRKAVLHR